MNAAAMTIPGINWLYLHFSKRLVSLHTQACSWGVMRTVRVQMWLERNRCLCGRRQIHPAEPKNRFCLCPASSLAGGEGMSSALGLWLLTIYGKRYLQATVKTMNPISA